MRHTFTAMTHNLWGDWDLPRRAPALSGLLAGRSPDLLGVQELSPGAVELIDAALPGHARVVDDAPGWREHANLWWDRELFAEVEHGLADIGMPTPDRGLSWVRLRHVEASDLAPLVLASAHLTFPGNAEEVRTERSPRTEQARSAARELNRLAGGDPVILCIDINDYARPLWAFYDDGFREPFGTLGRTCPITHPVTPRLDKPMRWEGVQVVEKALDWLFFNGALRPRTAEVVDYFLDGVAPSDHKPVTATFTQGAVA